MGNNTIWKVCSNRVVLLFYLLIPGSGLPFEKKITLNIKKEDLIKRSIYRWNPWTNIDRSGASGHFSNTFSGVLELPWYLYGEVLPGSFEEKGDEDVKELCGRIM